MRMMLIVAVVLGLAAPVSAEEFVCKGERIEKGSSTWGKAVRANGDYRIEKGSSSIGWAKKRNDDWAIETFGGSTLGWLRGDKIEKPSNASWSTLSEAKKLAKDCPDPVAAAMWVLDQSGKL